MLQPSVRLLDPARAWRHPGRRTFAGLDERLPPVFQGEGPVCRASAARSRNPSPCRVPDFPARRASADVDAGRVALAFDFGVVRWLAKKRRPRQSTRKLGQQLFRQIRSPRDPDTFKVIISLPGASAKGRRGSASDQIPSVIYTQSSRGRGGPMKHSRRWRRKRFPSPKSLPICKLSMTS